MHTSAEVSTSPVGAPSPFGVQEFDIGPRPGDRLVVRQSEDGAHISLWIEGRHKPMTIDIRVRGDVGVKVSDGVKKHWSMVSGLARGLRRDVLAQLPVRYRLSIGGRIPDAPLGAGQARLDTVMVEVGRHLARQALNGPRHEALRYPTHLRMYVYRQLAGDETGRLMQLSRTCPGAMGVCAWLEQHEEEAAAERFFQGVREGRRLNDLLALLLRSWARTGYMDGQERAWEYVRGLSDEEHQAMIRRQRLLIRRAPAAVPQLMLVLPPPPGLVVDDMPRTRRALIAWFRLIKQPLLYPLSDTEKHVSEHMTRYLGRHGAYLRRELGLPRQWPVRLYNHIALNNPGLDLSPQHMVEALRSPGMEVPFAVDPTRVFPAPMPSLVHGDLSLMPLETATAIRDEGRRMGHCVAIYIPSVVRGTSAIYSIRQHRTTDPADDMPLATMEVVLHENRWWTAQARGPHNTDPCSAAWGAIDAFRAKHKLDWLAPQEQYEPYEGVIDDFPDDAYDAHDDIPF